MLRGAAVEREIDAVARQPQPLQNTTAAMARLIAGSSHSHPVSMMMSAATTTPSETPASATICR